MAPVERRQNRRRVLRDRTRVTLHLDTDNGEAVYEGWLLNMSTDGLACKVTTEVAEKISQAEAVYAEFWVGSSGAFHLTTRVITVTPSTKGHAVLGLATSDDPESMVVRKKLQRVLQDMES